MNARAKHVVLGVLAVAAAALAAWWSYRYSEARAHFRAAQSAMQKDDLEAARHEIAHCLPWWNDRFEVRILAAQAARRAGYLDEAEEHLSFCEKEFRGKPELRKERALLQIRQGDLEGFLETIAPQGIQDASLPSEVLETLARGFMATYLDNSAIQSVALLLQKDPQYGRGHLLAGELATKIKRTEEATEHFTRAVEHSPDNLLPRLRLAENLMEVGELREAAPHLALLRSRFPEDPVVAEAQVKWFVYRGQRDEAKRLLDEVLTKHARRYSALVERGRLEVRDGDAAKAAAYFEQAIAIQPFGFEARRGLVDAYEFLDRPQDLKKAQEEMVRVARELGEVSQLEMNVKPHDIAQTIELARRCALIGLLPRALGWHMRTLQLDPGHAPTHTALAEYFEAQGQPHLAARHRKQAHE